MAAGLSERQANGELLDWMPEVEARIESINNAYFGFEEEWAE